VASSRSSDIRALLGAGAEEDRLAVSHFLTGAAYLVVGGILALFGLLAIRFPSQSPISFGRIEMMSNLTLMVGFVVTTLTGGVYYVVPRLTGSRLARVGLARLGLLALAGLTALGVVAIFLGFGDGIQPMGLAWWLDVPLAIAVTIPAIVVFDGLRHRVETHSYVTLWFVIGGVVWLPLLFWASTLATLPLTNSLAQAYGGGFLSAGLVNMWLLTVGFGLFYYSLVKEMDIPLASRQLALAGFWSLGFAAAWWGASQLIFGPGPDWLDGVAAALGLALPIGALANAANYSLTLENSWSDLPEHPGLSSGVMGAYLAVVVAALAAFGSYPSIGATVGLTSFWEGIEYAFLLGVAPMLAAGTVFPGLSRLVGREIPSRARVRTFNRMTMFGSGGVLVSLVSAGIYAGYTWIGGSNGGAFVDVGEGWAQTADPTVGTLTLIAVGFGVVSLLGQFAYAGVVFGTLTTGKAVEQEVLVAKAHSDG
jgi:cytochrome c oxidase cbb3-type subunit I